MITEKAIKSKMMHATRAELTKLIKKINRDHPEIGREIFTDHRPSKEPVKPLPDDPLLKFCFHCSSKDQDDLNAWCGLMVSYVICASVCSVVF